MTSVRLLTNNPAKAINLEDYGIAVTERVRLTPHPNDHNLAYLLTKRDRMGHDMPHLHDAGAPTAERRRTSVSGEGSPDAGLIDCHDLRVAVVAASWHEPVMDGLIAGAQRALADYQVEARRPTGSPARSSCPWSRRHWPRRATRRWWPWAW